MAEFTGERVIPSEVNTDLWNEHVARYTFAARYAQRKRVLDVGCGAGYGAAQLSQVAADVIAVDVAAEAVSYGRTHYAAPNLRFVQGSCAALPVASASIDLAVAFELIEHVREWEAFLAEVRRVLAPRGQLIVSTPNKFYYGESRGPSGPNPYHVHEFEFDEFRGELGRFFPHASFFLQNHADAIVFQALEAGSPGKVRVEHDAAGSAESHFFIAVCAVASQPAASTFVYVPKSANVLRERELHIHRLEGELATKDQWLEEAKQEHQQVLSLFRAQTAELEESNRWAEDLDRQLKEARERITGLQDELIKEQAAAAESLRELQEENIRKTEWAIETETRLSRELAEAVAGYERQLRELEEENIRKTEWAIETETRLSQELADKQQVLLAKCQELEDKCRELATCVDLLTTAEATVVERTAWAQRTQAELEQAQALLSYVRASRWVRLGRTVGLGPELKNG